MIIIRKPSDVVLNEKLIQLVEMISHGYSPKAIGDQLHMSPRTVEAHLAWLRQTFSATNTTHLIAKMMRAGVIK